MSSQLQLQKFININNKNNININNNGNDDKNGNLNHDGLNQHQRISKPNNDHHRYKRVLLSSPPIHEKRIKIKSNSNSKSANDMCLTTISPITTSCFTITPHSHSHSHIKQLQNSKSPSIFNKFTFKKKKSSLNLKPITTTINIEPNENIHTDCTAHKYGHFFDLNNWKKKFNSFSYSLNSNTNTCNNDTKLNKKVDINLKNVGNVDNEKDPSLENVSDGSKLRHLQDEQKSPINLLQHSSDDLNNRKSSNTTSLTHYSTPQKYKFPSNSNFIVETPPSSSSIPDLISSVTSSTHSKLKAINNIHSPITPSRKGKTINGLTLPGTDGESDININYDNFSRNGKNPARKLFTNYEFYTKSLSSTELNNFISSSGLNTINNDTSIKYTNNSNISVIREEILPLSKPPLSTKQRRRSYNNNFNNNRSFYPFTPSHSNISPASLSSITCNPRTSRSNPHLLHPHFNSYLDLEQEKNNIWPKSQTITDFALNIPEILLLILKFLDEDTILPYKYSSLRKNPLSYHHAYLLYDDETIARQVWQETLNETYNTTKLKARSRSNPRRKINNNQRESGIDPFNDNYKQFGNLYNCALVSWYWNHVTNQILRERIFFDDYSEWLQFLNFRGIKYQAPQDEIISITKPKPVPQEYKQKWNNKNQTRIFILHDLNNITSQQLITISPIIGNSLIKLELTSCKFVLPPISLLSGLNLKKFILTGSYVMTNNFLRNLSKNCSNLLKIDISDCHGKISDLGIISIAKNCKNLKNLNLNRSKYDNTINDISIISIAKYTKIINLSITNCNITDKSILKLSKYRGFELKRLCINDCFKISDKSVSEIFNRNGFSNIEILEIKHCKQIKNLKPLIEFKKKLKDEKNINFLIDGCKTIENRIRLLEWEMNLEIRREIIQDVTDLINNDDDNDNDG